MTVNPSDSNDCTISPIYAAAAARPHERIGRSLWAIGIMAVSPWFGVDCDYHQVGESVVWDQSGTRVQVVPSQCSSMFAVWSFPHWS